MQRSIRNGHSLRVCGIYISLTLLLIIGCDESLLNRTETVDVAVVVNDIPLDEITGADGTLEGKGRVVWGKAVGSRYSDYISSVQETVDKGFIAAGHTRQKERNVADDIWVLKLDEDLNVTWSKAYAGIMNENAYSVIQTADQGYVVAGERRYYDVMDEFNLTTSYKYDTYIVKLDKDGEIIWEKHYGGDDYDRANEIEETDDGGLIIAGHSQSYGAKYTPMPHAKKDLWIFKLDSQGDMEWEMLYGEADGSDGAYSISQTVDGGYAATGFTDSYGAGGFDCLVIKITQTGVIEWTKTFGGSKTDVSRSIEQTQDGGYLVAGETWSSGNGNFDCWLLRLDTNGNPIWEKTFGDMKFERAFSVRETSDQSILVAGYTSSSGAGSKEFLLIKYDGNGNLLWSTTYGGYSYDKCNALIETSDGAIVAAGTTSSYGEGEIDLLLLKINE